MDKKYNVENRDVGVTVARFQIDELHSAHKELIEIMLKTHKRIIVVLGLSPLQTTPSNPLDLRMRKQAFLEAFPIEKYNNIQILYLNNCETDEQWSNNLDSIIKKNTHKKESVRLCGGRDSFLSYYKNSHEKWKIDSFEQEEFISATSRRNEITRTTVFDVQFRRGVIHTATNIHPQCIPSVDIIIYDQDTDRILMGQRLDEVGYCFIGTWLKARETFEDACHRAAKQKTGLELDEIKYFKSFADFDWRFSGEVHDLTTMVYIVTKKDGRPDALDNMVSLKWVSLNEILNVVCNRHKNIAKSVVEELDYIVSEIHI